jgi:transposase
VQKIEAGNSICRFDPASVPETLKSVLQFAASELKGRTRRAFMGLTVNACGHGGQRWAEEKLAWNRGTIRKGQGEIRSGVPTDDAFSHRGRKKVEIHLPCLLSDIKAIAEPVCQTDPTFRTTQLYLPLTAKNMRGLLITEKGYTDQELPTIRTISTKLNLLGYRPQRVAKSKPTKKIKETDAIFEQVHRINREADATDGVLRISLDAKAAVKVGPFSRGGQNRRHTSAQDHDFTPESVLSLFGFLLPAHNDVHFFFSKSKITADFIIDALESLWHQLKQTYHPDTLVLNLDNGPENHSRRTQFIKRIVEFAQTNSVTIKLAYYPPYHSKYNPIERVWGRLENHWNGQLLETEETVLGLASTMTWNDHTPQIQNLENKYESGKKLSAKEMRQYEKQIHRLPELPKWFVEIPPNAH